MTDESDHHTFATWVTFGVLTLITTGLGYYGARHLNKRRFLKFYSIFLMLLGLGQFTTAMFRITQPSWQSEKEKSKLMHLFEQEDRESEAKFNDLEARMKCCGVTNYDDYEEKFDPLL
ncbi:Tetraspannin domain containing protein, partial [Asbolus verrucosus]